MKKSKMPSKKAKAKEYEEEAAIQSTVNEPLVAYTPYRESVKRFIVKRKGHAVTFETRRGYGYFINRLREANNSLSLRDILSAGFSRGDVEPVRAFFHLPQTKIAEAAAVSESTVSRWNNDSNIGRPGSEIFFKMDELIRQGVELFGTEEAFYEWVNQPNMALGNIKPLDLMMDQVGIDMVEEAIDALHFGNLL